MGPIFPLRKHFFPHFLPNFYLILMSYHLFRRLRVSCYLGCKFRKPVDSPQVHSVTYSTPVFIQWTANVWNHYYLNPKYAHHPDRGTKILALLHASNMSEFNDDEEVLKLSCTNPEKFWELASNNLVWDKPWTKILDSDTAPLYKWFVGGELNLTNNLVDRHVVQGKGHQLALIVESTATGTRTQITFEDLLDKVSKFAGVLTNMDVHQGDVVLIYMPNVLDLTVALLATFRIGAVALIPLPNSTVPALADRIQLSQPKVFVTANCTRIGKNLIHFKKCLDEAVHSLNYRAKMVVLQRPQFEAATLNPHTDILWEDATSSAKSVDCVPVEFNKPAIIMYTSGTTGKPKGILYTVGGLLVMLTIRLMFSKIYILKNHKVSMFFSHPGWVSGIYGSLKQIASGACTVILDGAAAENGDPSTIYNVISRNKVEWLMLTTPALREIRLADPEGQLAKQYDFSSVTSVNTGGENLEQLSRDWAQKVFKVTLLEAWGQSEGPGAFESLHIMNNENLCSEDRRAKLPLAGLTYSIFGANGKVLSVGEPGKIAARLPLPPTCLATLYQDDDLYIKTYCSEYPGYFNTKDVGWLDEKGRIHVVGRSDNVIKVSGYRMTTTEIEEAIFKNVDVAECAVFTVRHQQLFQMPVAYYTLAKGNLNEDLVAQQIVDNVRNYVGPTAAFDVAVRVNRILKTQTGKINKTLIQTELQRLTGEVAGDINHAEIIGKMTEAAKNLGML